MSSIVKAFKSLAIAIFFDAVVRRHSCAAKARVWQHESKYPLKRKNKLHVFAPSMKHIKSERRWSLVQLSAALLGAFVAAIPLIFALKKGGDSLDAAGLCFATAGFGGVVQSVRTWLLFFGNPKVRVILNSRSIAAKLRGKPALFFKRSTCFAFAPEENVFYFSDGSQFTPRAFIFLMSAWREVPEFIFRHWWPDLDLATMKREVEKTYPITKWTLVPYFGAIFVMFVLALTALIGGMTGMMSKSIVVALWGAVAVLGYDWSRRHQWLLRRESERRLVRFDLSAIESAAIQRG